ncbi:MAG: gliding motility-associated protein GldE [Bacteroidales bacterium]
MMPFCFQFLGWTLLAILFMVSASMSAAGAAIFSLSTHDLERLTHADTPSLKRVQKLRRYPKQLFFTILTITILANISFVILGSVLMGYSFVQMTESWGFWQWLIWVGGLSLLILIFTEVLPKMFALKNALKTACILSGIVSCVSCLFYPLSRLLARTQIRVDRHLEKPTEELSMEDLADAIEMATTPEKGERVDFTESKILKSIVDFADTEVNSIMRPRNFVTGVEVSMPFDQLLALIVDAAYSRMPVYKENLDNIVGVLHIKDLLPHINECKDFDWTPWVRPALFVQESKRIDALFKELKDKKIHLAIVVDEYGGTSGIVTLEDIMEEVVGEISDEFDKDNETVFYQKLENNTFLFDALTNTSDFCEVLNLTADFFDDCGDDFETLAGFMLENLDGFPIQGDVVEYKGIRFVVEVMERKRIKRIRVFVK